MDTPATSGIKLPPPVYFASALALGLLVEYLFPLNVVPAPWRVVGYVLVGLSPPLPIWAVVTLKRAQTTSSVYKKPAALVTMGPYRITRNPMYLSLVMLYLGLCVSFDLVWAAAVLPLVIVLVDVTVIRREEAFLHGLFGDAYAQYTTKVRRWI